MNGKNMVHLADERVHVRLWMHRIYIAEIYGIHIPRLGGWT